MGYLTTGRRPGARVSTVLAAALTVVVILGCSRVEWDGTAEVAQPATTVVAGGNAQGGNPAAVENRELQNPDDVEALVREFGGCVANQAPDAAMVIWFDASSGYVGSARSTARTSDALHELGLAMHQCDAALAYRRSVNAYIEANPDAGERGPNGLPLDRGEQLLFGERTLLQPLEG